jgi:hypothetical protein
MKRIVVLAVALGALAIAVPAAQTAPTSESGCTVEHLSPAPCQGPDLEPAANFCEITTWVGDASCDLTVADGIGNSASGFVKVFSAVQDTTWHAEFHLLIRDKATGAVLFSRDVTSDIPIAESTTIPDRTLGFATSFAAPAGAEATCEVTGTHTPAGAPFSLEAVERGFGEFNNVLRCEVR